ncbi:MAG: redoxin domain-containing protein [Gammaproteobacteria bacterium]|nr:redoxin domain-containing protein [Gammaproteobacteria bacterium]
MMRIILSLLTGLIMLTAYAVTLADNLGHPAPELLNETWLNTKPLHLTDLKGKVVMVEFWTYGCYNCRNVEPYVKQWNKKFAPQGLVVIGVHSPEFDSERDIENVKRYVREHGITYPVAIDNDFATWRNYNNRYWPAMYLIDKQGVIRYVHIGEGEYALTEQKIQSLLAEG